MASNAHNRACMKWAKNNRDKVRVYEQRYRAKHIEKIKAQRKAWNEAHIAESKAYNRKSRLAARDAVIAHYGGKCFCCGESNKGFLTVDHIDGVAPEIAVVGKKLGHSALYKYLVRNNFPEGYRVACANCNLGISWWGVCPHKQVPY